MNKNTAISLTGVTKIYQLHHDKPTLVEAIFKPNRREKFVALDNINLEIKKGERIGLIGPNGSGKTTLLKIITGVATPNRGKVKIYGKIVSLIDLGAGFHPELTGIENIFQNALLLGMSREETRGRLEEIIAFADIGGFIDSPMYTYSDGMRLRLGFSIALAADPDILMLDEGFAVGDENFQKKTLLTIDAIVARGKTILVASHWIEYLRQNCDKYVWLQNGKLVEFGGREVLERYAAG